MAEDISALVDKINELKLIVNEIMVDNKVALVRNDKNSELRDVRNSTSSIANSMQVYMPMLYNQLVEIATDIYHVSSSQSKASNSEASETGGHVAAIHTDTDEVVKLMNNLMEKQDDAIGRQDDYYDNLINNSEIFVDNSEEEKKKGNIFTRMMGGIKASIGGFFSGLFAPKPKVVILAKQSIKDIAGLFKAFSPSNGATLKDKVKDKVGSSVAEAVAKSIEKIGNALVGLIKALKVMLTVALYVVLPLTILGAVLILAVALYFIAKMIVDTLGEAISTLINAIAEAIPKVIDIISRVVDSIVGIVDVIKNAISTVLDYYLAPMKIIANVVTAIGDAIVEVINLIRKFVSSPTKVVGAAVSGVKNFFGIGGANTSTEASINPTEENLVTAVTFDFTQITDPICDAINAFSNTALDFTQITDPICKSINSLSKSPVNIKNFSQLTDPICQSISDLSEMLYDYMESLSKYNPVNIVTNTISNAAHKVWSFLGIEPDESGNNTANPNVTTRNQNRNTSTPSDGNTNNFNQSMLSRYSTSYTNNTMNNNTAQGNDIRELLAATNETNNLLNRLINLLESSRNDDSISGVIA